MINAVYENGVFRPEGTVDLAEGARVAVLPLGDGAGTTAGRLPSDLSQMAPTGESWDSLHATLSQRFDSGHTDTAERHNEHQP